MTIYQGKTKKGIDLVIRYVINEDLEKLLEYINTLSKEQTFIRFQGEQMTLEEEKKYLDDFFKKQEAGKAIELLAFIKNELVGVADIHLEDKISSHIGIFGITVKKEFRGEGIGKLLMELVIKEAQKNLKGLQIITLGVFANNPLAKAIYEKFGFKEYGCLPEGILHKEKYVDHLYMYKKVNELTN